MSERCPLVRTNAALTLGVGWHWHCHWSMTLSTTLSLSSTMLYENTENNKYIKTNVRNQCINLFVISGCLFLQTLRTVCCGYFLIQNFNKMRILVLQSSVETPFRWDEKRSRNYTLYTKNLSRSKEIYSRYTPFCPKK